jgi:hypothetical protein
VVKAQLSLYERGIVATHAHLGAKWNFRYTARKLDCLRKVGAVVATVYLSEGRVATTVTVGSLEWEVRSFKIFLVDFILDSVAFVIADALSSRVFMGLHWINAKVLFGVVCFVAFGLLLLLLGCAQDVAYFIFL